MRFYERRWTTVRHVMPVRSSVLELDNNELDSSEHDHNLPLGSVKDQFSVFAGVMLMTRR